MDPDRKHDFGHGPPVTPLGFAVHMGSMEVVKTLLSNHAAVGPLVELFIAHLISAIYSLSLTGISPSWLTVPWLFRTATSVFDSFFVSA
jgi:hypothetical protein